MNVTPRKSRNGTRIKVSRLPKKSDRRGGSVRRRVEGRVEALMGLYVTNGARSIHALVGKASVKAAEPAAGTAVRSRRPLPRSRRPWSRRYRQDQGRGRTCRGPWRRLPGG